MELLLLVLLELEGLNPEDVGAAAPLAPDEVLVLVVCCCKPDPGAGDDEPDPELDAACDRCCWD